MQSRLFISLIIILSCLNVNLYSQTWEKIYEYEFTGHINDLQFDSLGNFYVASDSGLLCSKDRGVTWINLYPTPGFNNFVYRVLPYRSSEIFIIAKQGILHSEDSGLTWSGDSSNIGVNFLVMDKEENIYADWVAAIYKSTDKGKSWNKLKDSLYVWSFYITSEGNMLAGTDCGIFLSEDKGYNWTRTGFFDCGDVTYIKGTTNDEIIFIVGADRFRGIRYSSDGGYNWKYVNDSDTIRWGSSIIPVNNNEVYVASSFNGVFRYNISDLSLTGINDGLQFGVTAMAYDSLGYLYAASDGIYRTKETLDPDKHIRNSVYSYSLAQNYPNPFNSNTIIEYSLESPGQVNITLFNLLGETVSEILNEFKSKGNYKIVFNAKSLASGIYLYQIRTGGFTQTKKMILLR